MNSTMVPKAIEPNDVLIARADERLAHAYDKIARADEQLARLNEQLWKLEHDTANQPSPVVGRSRPQRGRSALRGLIGLLLALCIFAGAFVSQSSYGDATKLIVARWTPQLALTSSLPTENPGLPAQATSTAKVTAATPLLPQLTPSAQTTQQDIAPESALTSPELAQLLQAMARNLANVEQGIEQLKANQEQTARENAKATEQLKASQEQLTRLIAKASDQSKASEQNQRPKILTPLMRPIATATGNSVPTHQSSQARSRPRAPTQLQSDDQ
jgi:hypothetical protein